jgi:hypothetical protein
MKWFCFIFIGFCLSQPAMVSGQNFIGKHKSEVRKLMKENMKELYEDKSSRNTVYNLLKYIDASGNQTMIHVFSEEDTCLYTKWMCDYSMLNKVVSDLNGKYMQTADDSWHYRSEGVDYRVTLKTGDWFFTITTKPEDKE